MSLADPAKRNVLKLGFRVDNLRWTPDGCLFVTGHVEVPGETTNDTKIVKIDPAKMKAVGEITLPGNPMFAHGSVTLQFGDALWLGSPLYPSIAIIPDAMRAARR